MVKIHILPSAMAYNHTAPFLNTKNEAQCVELLRQALHAPSTPHWVEGQKIVRLKPGEKDPISAGTPIATFVNGEYPEWSGTGHAAIYLSQNAMGIQVLDQWETKRDIAGLYQGKPDVSERTIYWTHGGPHDLIDDGNAFSVVEW